MGACGGDPPAQPDPAAGIWQGYLADLETLPARKAIEAAARSGQRVTLDGVRYDFTGLGEADYQQQYADAMAQTVLGLQADYGPDLLQQRLDELERADPEGSQTRADLWGLLQRQAAQSPDLSAANALQSAVLDDLRASGALSPLEQTRAEQQARGRQAALGNYLGNAPALEEARALAAASDAKAAQAQQNALAFLSSGTTPEDIQYRRAQQTLANLGAFINGQSPAAQFAQLSGAQNQAVPFLSGLPGVGTDSAAPLRSLQFQSGLYGADSAWAPGQANPWLTGLSFAIQGGKAAPGIAAAGARLFSSDRPS